MRLQSQTYFFNLKTRTISVNKSENTLFMLLFFNITLDFHRNSSTDVYKFLFDTKMEN